MMISKYPEAKSFGIALIFPLAELTEPGRTGNTTYNNHQVQIP